MMILSSVALFLSTAVAAADAAPPDAAITPAPHVEIELARRLAISTLGWYSYDHVGSSTIWDYVTYDADITTWVTSGNYFRRCAKTSTLFCPMYTQCSSGYMVAATTSSYCGQIIATCSYDLLYSSVGATSALTRFWCDDPTFTGESFYAQSPTGAVVAPTQQTSSVSFIVKTVSPTFTPSQTETPSPSTPTAGGSTVPAPAATTSAASAGGGGGGSNKTGIIAGATIGGIALVGAFVIAIIFLLRRRHNQQQPPPAPPQPYYPQAPMGPPMTGAAYVPEKAPMVANAPMPVPDPRSTYYSAGSVSPPPHTPLPLYPTNMNELPTAYRQP